MVIKESKQLKESMYFTEEDLVNLLLKRYDEVAGGYDFDEDVSEFLGDLTMYSSDAIDLFTKAPNTIYELAKANIYGELPDNIEGFVDRALSAILERHYNEFKDVYNRHQQ